MTGAPSDDMQDGCTEDVMHVSEYRTAVVALQAVKDKLLAASSLSKDDADAMRKELALKSMNLRRVRREVLIGHERRKAGAVGFGEKVAQMEHKVVATREVAETTGRCLTVMHASTEKVKDIEGKLHIPLDRFKAENPLPEGTTETECELLKRRIQHEIDLAAAKSDEVTALNKKRVEYGLAVKSFKKFFQASVAPLEELVAKVQHVHTSLGGVPDAVGGTLAALLPVTLYKVQQCLIAGVGETRVRIEGEVAEAKKFIKADKHLGKSSSDLFPLRVVAQLKGSAALRFYFRVSTQHVVVEAVGFDPTILLNISVEHEKHTLLFPPLALVTCFTLSWVTEGVASAVRLGADSYDARGLMAPITALLKEIDYRRNLTTIFSILKNKSCLGLSSIVGVMQEYLPTYPAPKVSVGEVNVDHAGRPDEAGGKDGRKQAIDAGCELPAKITVSIDMDHICYTVTAVVGKRYPHTAPHFTLSIDERTDGVRKSNLKIPSALMKLVAPVAEVKDVGASLALSALPGQDVRVLLSGDDAEGVKGRSLKRKANPEWQSSPPKYAAVSIDAGVVGEVQDHFAQSINRDVVQQTGADDLGNVLMRQLLMSVFFVEAFHPYLVRRGVAVVCSSDHSRPMGAVCTALHRPADFRLLHHNTTPLHRGRVVQLPTHWHTDFLRWSYKPPTEAATAQTAQQQVY